MTAVPFEKNYFDHLRIQLVLTLLGFAMKYCLTEEENPPKSFAPVNEIYEDSKAPDFF